MGRLQIISPVDGSVYREVEYAESKRIDNALRQARSAQSDWHEVPLSERLSVCRRFVDIFLRHKPLIAEELTWQMGRPLVFSPKEVDRAAERSTRMIELAAAGLASIDHSDSSARRIISRRPYGVALVIAPWNYPLLTAINTVVPALISGNAVILKPASQTFLTGQRIVEAFREAGLPPALLHSLLMSHDEVARLLRERQVDFVSFTGSVRGGMEIEKAAAGSFLPISLELGGKDPAYVARDADLDFTVAELVDGSFFNSGQSCCAVERIYVDRAIYKEFVGRFVDVTGASQRLGNPTHPETTLGPVVTQRAADAIRAQVTSAISAGAKMVAGDDSSIAGDNYMPATALTDVNHLMTVMTEETFGPVVGIMPVSGPGEAVQLMNDSRYGLSASIWTKESALALSLPPQINAGTVFVNRCDYLDPSLVWTGVKDSGRGCSLSELGFHSVTRPASLYAR